MSLSDEILKLRLAMPKLDPFHAAELIYEGQEKKIKELEKKLDDSVNSDILPSTGVD